MRDFGGIYAYELNVLANLNRCSSGRLDKFEDSGYIFVNKRWPPV